MLSAKDEIMHLELRSWIKLVETLERSMPEDAVDIKGNWKTFDALPNDALIVLYHATSNVAANAILKDGFNQTKKVWAGSIDGYVFLGASPRTIEMYGYHAARHGETPSCLMVTVRKSDIFPDDGRDWMAHCKQASHRDFVQQWFGKNAVKSPTPTATLACIGQVRALIDKVQPISIVSL